MRGQYLAKSTLAEVGVLNESDEVAKGQTRVLVAAVVWVPHCYRLP